jgi:hypothetical protein
VIKSQPLLNYDVGGHFQRRFGRYGWTTNTGFIPCIAVRYRQYKLVGLTGQVYRMRDGNHMENACTEVSEPAASQLRQRMEAAARGWWKSLLQEPHSFSKPVYYLGWRGSEVSSLPAEGAYVRTSDAVQLLEGGARGFERPGDKICWHLKVLLPGRYVVGALYQSTVAAKFRISVGQSWAIAQRSAPSIVSTLPAQVRPFL